MDGVAITHSGCPLVRGGDCYSTVVTKYWVKKPVHLRIGNQVSFIFIEQKPEEIRFTA